MTSANWISFITSGAALLSALIAVIGLILQNRDLKRKDAELQYRMEVDRKEFMQKDAELKHSMEMDREVFLQKETELKHK